MTINSETSIYRIVDFFEFVNMLSEGVLRFSKVSTYIDDNEGIMHLLCGAEIMSGPCKGAVGSSWNSTEEAIEVRNQLKGNCYSCCWTQAKDSIAMWSLYSPDKLSIRIQTTVGALQESLDNYIAIENNKRSDNFVLSKPNKPFLATKNALIDEVTYVNLQSLYKKIALRGRAYRRLEQRYAKNNKEIKYDILNKTGQDRYISDASNPFLLKDDAYHYEREIRSLIEVGQVSLKKDLHEKMLLSLNQDDNDGSFLRHLISPACKHDYPDYLYLPITTNLIKSVCIDPRCQSHKKKHIQDVIRSYSIKLTTSDAFGYLPTYAEFSKG